MNSYIPTQFICGSFSSDPKQSTESFPGAIIVVPKVVSDAVTDYLLNHNANTHWAYPTSSETDTLIADARHTIGEFLNDLFEAKLKYVTTRPYWNEPQAKPKMY